jgi:hypothetical protein
MKAFILSLTLLGLSTSCASYKATTLSNLPHEASKGDEVTIVARAFTKEDCKKYLDRDVIAKGYQPIHLYIENATERTYLFALERLTLATVPPDEVAKQVHTSTWGRTLGYGAAAFIATPLFIIPAVVDGVKSSKANDILDQDFANKAAKNQLIGPFSQVNMLVFVPADSTQKSFSVTLLDEKNSKPKRIVARIQENP